jgi:uncharacterized protein (DUF4415 family)
MAIVSYTEEELKELKGETDWERVLNMKDEDIVLDEDSPDVTELLKSGRARYVGRRGRPALAQEERTIPISIRLEREAVESLRALGAGWQTRLSEKISSWLREGAL